MKLLTGICHELLAKQRLRVQFIQEWQSSVAEIVSTVIIVYLKDFKKKTYLPSALRQRVLTFRLSNHRQRRSLGIPRNERICTVCDSSEVGDEFHYLLNCSNENVKRNHTKYVDKYYTHHPNVPKFCSLMNMTSKSKKSLSLLNLLVASLRYFD